MSICGRSSIGFQCHISLGRHWTVALELAARIGARPKSLRHPFFRRPGVGGAAPQTAPPPMYLLTLYSSLARGVRGEVSCHILYCDSW